MVGGPAESDEVPMLYDEHVTRIPTAMPVWSRYRECGRESGVGEGGGGRWRKLEGAQVFIWSCCSAVRNRIGWWGAWEGKVENRGADRSRREALIRLRRLGAAHPSRLGAAQNPKQGEHRTSSVAHHRSFGGAPGPGPEAPPPCDCPKDAALESMA